MQLYGVNITNWHNLDNPDMNYKFYKNQNSFMMTLLDAKKLIAKMSEVYEWCNNPV